MFLTAASSNHFKSVKQFIKSLNGAPVIFYDIGLTEIEAEEIKGMPIEYRLFDWSNVPEWGLLTSPNAGSYLWKPLIIQSVLLEAHDILIWCDAGNKIQNIIELESYVKSVSIYTPYSNGSLRRWTHSKCLDGMNMTVNQRKYPMRNAAIIGFNARKPIVKQFVEEWKLCSLKEELIVGDRNTHRCDQSILSCLFYKYNMKCTIDYVGLTIHNDCD
jgi:hypothetical protein